ncbi:Protein CBG25583 [Caenorhabditis briggsae]|uniref:Protein CBG25583 n=1 Tax=Caenorhabditis briggsae TaxID=6238 RepID=B6IF70_CAEBR|nr:Protein CBG25583 [Caenorhabditis briggsae]CAR98550.1 Protein CBG25583 [Caenorhabditis briggsae]
MESNLEKLEEDLLQINKNTRTLQTNHIQLLEMKAGLKHVTFLMDHQSKSEAAMSISEAARGEAGPFSVGLKQEFDKPVRDDNELK